LYLLIIAPCRQLDGMGQGLVKRQHALQIKHVLEFAIESRGIRDIRKSRGVLLAAGLPSFTFYTSSPCLARACFP
jgi:hypothetical protein